MAKSKSTYKYRGYTFIPKGTLAVPYFEAVSLTRHNPCLEATFDNYEGTWNYKEFYKDVPSIADIFEVKELGNVLVIPATNYLFEWTGNEATYNKV